MTVDTSAQIRVMRALLGMSRRDFAARLGVSSATLAAWEHGRNTPQGKTRQVLAELCQEHGIAFLPSGMPVPFAECFTFKPGTFTGWDSRPSPAGKRAAHLSAATAPVERKSADGWSPTEWPSAAPRTRSRRAAGQEPSTKGES